MRNTIKKILKESRFTTKVHQQLSNANDKTARFHGVDPDDWYLGSQIYYYHSLEKQSGTCIFLGSPDYDILAERLALINTEAEVVSKGKGYETYCDIINQYYDLDNFSIPNDDKSIYAFIDRFVNLVFLDEHIDAENFLTDPEEYGHLLGFEYNDWDPEDEIGTHRTQMIAILYGIFNRDMEQPLNDWVDNKIRTDQYRYV